MLSKAQVGTYLAIKSKVTIIIQYCIPSIDSYIVIVMNDDADTVLTL